MSTPLDDLLDLIDQNIKVNSTVVSPYKTTGHMLKETFRAIANYSGSGIPIGTIVAWSKPENEIPPGWKLCDGDNNTEDLRGKSVFGHKSGDPFFGILNYAGVFNYQSPLVVEDQYNASSSIPYRVENWIQYIGFGEAPVITSGLDDITLNTYEDYSQLNRLIEVEGLDYSLSVTDTPIGLEGLTFVGDTLIIASPLAVPLEEDTVEVEITASNFYGQVTGLITINRKIPPFEEPEIQYSNLYITDNHPSISPITYPPSNINLSDVHKKCVIEPDIPINQSLGYIWKISKVTKRGESKNGINASIDPNTGHITLDTDARIPGYHDKKNEGINYKNNQIYNIEIIGHTDMVPYPLVINLEVVIYLNALGTYSYNRLVYIPKNLNPSYLYSNEPSDRGIVLNNYELVDVSEVNNGEVIKFEPIGINSNISGTYTVSPTVPIYASGAGDVSDSLPTGSSLDPFSGKLNIKVSNNGTYWIKFESNDPNINLIRYVKVSINVSEQVFFDDKIIKSNSIGVTEGTYSGNLKYEVKLDPIKVNINNSNYQWSVSEVSNRIKSNKGLRVSIRSSDLQVKLLPEQSDDSGLIDYNYNGVYKFEVRGTEPIYNPLTSTVEQKLRVKDSFEVTIALTKDSSPSELSNGIYLDQYIRSSDHKYIDYNVLEMNTDVGELYKLDFMSYAESDGVECFDGYDFVKGVNNPSGNSSLNSSVDQSMLTIHPFTGSIVLQGPLVSSVFWIKYKKNISGSIKTMYTCIKTI